MKLGNSLDFNRKQAVSMILHVVNGNPSTPDVGQIWYDSAAGNIKYQNGSGTQTLGVAGGGGDADTLDGLDSTYFLARANHTGTQAIATIAAAATSRIFGRATAGAGAGEELTAAQVKTILALAAADISNFDTQVRTSRLDQMAAPTASVAMNNQKITGLATPTAGTDATTKDYVDGVAQGLSAKSSVRAASTANINLASPGATIDGVTMAANDRFLAKDQSTGSQNGIYVWNGAASAATRATDMDSAAEIQAGLYVFVEEGTTNADSGWVLTTDGAITVGTTSLAFAQFSGAGQITAGNGLTKTGNTLDVAVGAGLELSSDTVRIAAAAAGNGLTGGAGSALAVGAGTGISVAADAVSIDTAVVARKYAVTIGDAAATSFNIDHNLNTLDVQVQVVEVATGEQWIVNNARTTVNRVVVTFDAAPTNNQFRVIVLG